MMNNYISAFIRDDYNAHMRLLEKFKNEIHTLPEGSLTTKNIRGKNRYYQYRPAKVPGLRATETYLGKKDEELIAVLCRRKFIERSLTVLQEITHIQKLFFETCPEYNPTQIAQSLPEAYRGFNYSHGLDSVEITQVSLWIEEPYERSALYPENLLFTTQNGLRVRSKSEVIIAGLLETFDIPFRYEALLTIGEDRYYPDFTILNPQDNQIVYWEHFGMADIEEYAANMDKKMENYRKHGILQGNNLIVTMETKQSPLNVRKIRNAIKAYLLPES